MSLLLILLRPHFHHRRPSLGKGQQDPLSVLAADRNLGLGREDQVSARQVILRGRERSTQEG
jgi:hypothetical protein